jgi:hypothetical protein
MRRCNCALQHGCYAAERDRFTTVSAIQRRALAKALLHCNINLAGASGFAAGEEPPEKPAAALRGRAGVRQASNGRRLNV